MRSKILPVTLPELASYPGMTNFFSIIGINKTTLPWICDHFIQLIAPEKQFGDYATTANFYDVMFPYSMPMGISVPFLFTNLISRVLLANTQNDLIHYVERFIDEGYYVQVYLNQFYIKHSDNYRVRNLFHPTFIYGYDYENYTVNIADFYGGKYKQVTINFEALNQSFVFSDDTDISKLPFWVQNVYLYRKIDVVYNQNIYLMRQSISDYLNSTDSFHKMKICNNWASSNFRYGLAYYDYLIDELNVIRPDIRDYHVLYEHKKVAKWRIELLVKQGVLAQADYAELIPVADDLINRTEILRNMVLKAQIRNSVATDKKFDYRIIINQLAEIKSLDKVSFEKLYRLLPDN